MDGLPIDAPEATVADAALLSDVRLAEALGAGSVERTGWQPVTGGNAEVTRVHRLTIRRDEGAVETIIAKVPVEDTRRSHDGIRRMARREAAFYANFAATSNLRMPACLAIVEAPGRIGPALLLADVGGRAGDNHAGSDAATVATALSALAAFHAQWWRSPRLGRTHWLYDPVLRGLDMDDPHDFGSAWRHFAAAWSWYGLVTDEGAAVGEGLSSRIDWLHEAATAGDRTLAHADLHLENLRFPDDPALAPVFLDWQHTSRRPGASDVAKLLYTGLEAGVLAEREADLVAHYVEGLRAHGVNTDVETILPAVRVWGLAQLATYVSTWASAGAAPPEESPCIRRNLANVSRPALIEMVRAGPRD